MSQVLEDNDGQQSLPGRYLIIVTCAMCCQRLWPSVIWILVKHRIAVSSVAPLPCELSFQLTLRSPVFTSASSLLVVSTQILLSFLPFDSYLLWFIDVCDSQLWCLTQFGSFVICVQWILTAVLSDSVWLDCRESCIYSFLLFCIEIEMGFLFNDYFS